MAKAKELTPQFFTGLSKSRAASKSGSAFPRTRFEDDKSVTVQFLQEPTSFKEYPIHRFREGTGWQYVPCIGTNCPLCEDDEYEVKKTSWRFCCNIYNLTAKRQEIMDGPSWGLGETILFRYAKRPQDKKRFLKRTWDITRMSGTPTKYDVDRSEDPVVKTTKFKLFDLEGYLKERIQAYYKDDVPTGGSGKNALDDDAEEDSYDQDELEEMEWKELKRYAKSLGIKTEDRKRPELIRRILKKQKA